MRAMLSLIRREFSAYFLSPIAYVVLTVFLLGTGGLYYWAFDQLTASGPRGAENPMAVLLGDGSEGLPFPIFWLVFLFIPPLLTMRLFAEERGTGTMEMLMTAPIRDWQIVTAKFIGCFGFYLLMWLPTLLYIPALIDLSITDVQWTPSFHAILFLSGVGLVILGLVCLPCGCLRAGLPLLLIGLAIAIGGGYFHFTKDPVRLFQASAGIDPYCVWTSYLGVCAVGAMFLSLGLLISSLVRSQMVAALVSITVALPFMLFVLFLPQMDPSGWAYRVAAFFTVPHHFGRDFTRGVIDTRHLILYCSATLLFLFMTVRSVESLRR